MISAGERLCTVLLLYSCSLALLWIGWYDISSSIAVQMGALQDTLYLNIFLDNHEFHDYIHYGVQVIDRQLWLSGMAGEFQAWSCGFEPQHSYKAF